MADVLPEDLARFVRAVGPQPDDVIAEMATRADEEGFPTVGPEVGGVLAFLARVVGARRAFEFGSGFGYSAYWVARELPGDGTVVLTERDDDELDAAREFFERGGVADRARFESGDAVDVVEAYDAPLDLVLFDHEKSRYVEAFEAVRPKVPEGGVVVADNAMTAGPIQFEKLLDTVEGRHPYAVNEATQGIADYLEAVTDDGDFETVALPLGEGIAVSYRTG
jgi:predicted O-methyltransferase YrrM